MINNQNNKKFLVIPKWLRYYDNIKRRELIYPRDNQAKINVITKQRLESEYKEFKQNKTAHNAADLMGSAFVVGDIDLSRKLAKYVKRHQELNQSTIEFADRILNIGDDHSTPIIDKQISDLKRIVHLYPNHPIGWIEIARLYTIKNQIKSARRAVIIALNLAPFDRYIVRSGVRFFLHINEYDAAWFYIRKATKQISDPWLIATEVNISELAGMEIRNVKKLIPKDIDFDQIFHYSELIESYGMLELLSGNNKIARNNFKLAWKNPSENVVSHGEWIIRNKMPGLLKNTELNFSISNEAMSWRELQNQSLDIAMQFLREWELEEPYSKYPLLLGSYIAILDNRNEEAVEFAMRGIQRNPTDFFLINNLSYALLQSGDIAKAEGFLNNISKIEDDFEKIYFLATRGLLEFKKGNFILGREYYNKSIKLSNKSNIKRLALRAKLHLAIAEKEAGTKKSIISTKEAIKETLNNKDIDIIYIRKKLENNPSK